MGSNVQNADRYRLFTHGDLGAFEEIFREYQGEVYRWVLRIVRNSSVAEDLTIEAFWRIYRFRAHFDPKREFGAWARRIATNVALDQLKRFYGEEALAEEPQSQSLPEDLVLADEIRRKVERCLSALPVKLGVVARLALIEELSHREIASALGITEGAVKLRIFRATRLLRKKLRRLGIEP
jgi:RNA polymerase sigma-70 factor (ECF subfamily)